MAKQNKDWEKQFREIALDFPSVDTKIFSQSIQYDPEVFTMLMADLVKAQGKRSKPGKRPTLERSVAEDELKRLSLQDYSEHSFSDTFRALTRGRSVRGVANKTGLSTFKVHQFNHGVLANFSEMEIIAKAYAKRPTYFLEYRSAFILSVIHYYLVASPEVTTLWFHKLRGIAKMQVD